MCVRHIFNVVLLVQWLVILSNFYVFTVNCTSPVEKCLFESFPRYELFGLFAAVTVSTAMFNRTQPDQFITWSLIPSRDIKNDPGKHWEVTPSTKYLYVVQVQGPELSSQVLL